MTRKRAFRPLVHGAFGKVRLQSCIRITDLMEHWEDPHEALSLARIECHYFMNNSFFPIGKLSDRECRQDPQCPDSHRPGPLRCRLPDDLRLGAAPGVSRSRIHRRPRFRPFRFRERHHVGLGRCHGPVQDVAGSGSVSFRG